VSDTENTVNASNGINVPIFQPKILFYEVETSTGIASPFAKRTDYFTEAEKTLKAEPYFFSLSSNQLNSLKYEWFMNGNLIANLPNQPVVTLKNTNETGTALIKVVVTNPRKVLQSAEQLFTALFSRS
jgi:hypothetical protein